MRRGRLKKTHIIVKDNLEKRKLNLENGQDRNKYGRRCRLLIEPNDSE